MTAWGQKGRVHSVENAGYVAGGESVLFRIQRRTKDITDVRILVDNS